MGSRIGRIKLRIPDLMNKQIDNALKWSQLDTLSQKVSDLEGQTQYNIIGIEESSPLNAMISVNGYDYSKTPPELTIFPDISSRLDNLDIYEISLANIINNVNATVNSINNRVTTVESNVTSDESRITSLQASVDGLLAGGSSNVTLIQYIPNAFVSSITMPSNIKAGNGNYYLVRVWCNGLRLFQGDSVTAYDYWVSVSAPNIINVNGNAGDRFVIEYTPA